MTHMCPKCGKELTEDYQQVCECGFDFNTTISCPYRISNNCVHSGEFCPLTGLLYEDCETYFVKSGIAFD